MRQTNRGLQVFWGWLGIGLLGAGAAWGSDVGQWLFDEGVGTVASDRGGDPDMNLNLYDGASWTTDTPFAYEGNHALLLDGEFNHARVGWAGTQKTWFPPDQDFSVAAWIKTSYTDGWQYIASSRIDHGYVLGTLTGGQAFFFMRDSDGDSLALGSVVADGTWHHLAGVYDAEAGMTLYIDGSPAATDVVRPGTMNYNGAYYAVGTRSLVGDYPFSGAIDEVRLVNQALTPQDVMYDVQHSLATPKVTVDQVAVGEVTAMRFQSENGVQYQLEKAPASTPTAWSSAGVSQVGDGGTVYMYDPAGYSTQNVYRIVIEL